MERKCGKKNNQAKLAEDRCNVVHLHFNGKSIVILSRAKTQSYNIESVKKSLATASQRFCIIDNFTMCTVHHVYIQHSEHGKASVLTFHSLRHNAKKKYNFLLFHCLAVHLLKFGRLFLLFQVQIRTFRRNHHSYWYNHDVGRRKIRN